jgi:hypothetical protein
LTTIPILLASSQLRASRHPDSGFQLPHSENVDGRTPYIDVRSLKSEASVCDQKNEIRLIFRVFHLVFALFALRVVRLFRG